MPVKILLADKSITIQKVVEMLFSGREYDVMCVSDGETALNDAGRLLPDIVLADVDLPRIDGYTLSARLKQTPALGQTPVILMMSRDDVYDSARGKQAGIVDNIAKPFESQELIGKVKKAIAAAPPRAAEPAQPVAASRAAVEESRPAPAAPVEAAPSWSKPKQTTPADIFDIIQEAPTGSDLKQAADSDSTQAATPARAADESEYVVEAEVEEVDEPLAREIAKALPVGDKAMEEMRAGLGLSDKAEESTSEILSFESFDMGSEPTPRAEAALPGPAALRTEAPPAAPVAATPSERAPRERREEPVSSIAPEAAQPSLTESDLWTIAEQTVAKMAKDVFAKMPPVQAPQLSGEMVRSMAEEKISQLAQEAFSKMPPPRISEDTVREMVEDKVAKLANEVVKNINLPEPPTVPASELRGMAETTINRMTADIFKNMPPPPMPKISDETVRRGLEAVLSQIAREMAKEVIEQVAWEVIPQMAEHLIKEEIERLKAER